MAKGHVKRHWKDWDSRFLLGGWHVDMSPHEFRQNNPAFGIAPGEDIGIRELPHISVGDHLPRLPVQSPGTGAPVPLILAGSGGGGSSPSPSEEESPTYGDPEFDYVVIQDPEEQPPPTDWDQFHEDFIDLNPDLFPPEPATDEIEPPYTNEPPPQEGEPMPDIWDIGRGIIDIFDEPGAGQTPGFSGPIVRGSPGPYDVPAPGFEYNPKTGQIQRCRRRRRRRLLTESDFNDLMRISTLPNKENVRVALAKAIGRSR